MRRQSEKTARRLEQIEAGRRFAEQRAMRRLGLRDGADPDSYHFNIQIDGRNDGSLVDQGVLEECARTLNRIDVITPEDLFVAAQQWVDAAWSLEDLIGTTIDPSECIPEIAFEAYNRGFVTGLAQALEDFVNGPDRCRVCWHVDAGHTCCPPIESCFPPG